MSSIILRDLAVAWRCGIRPHELVLDVGSGQHPFLRANVLVDRFLDDNAERACGASAVVDRPLFVADATRLPFADDSFDVVVCSHLLEHVPEPAALLRELERVGRRGYIETPSRLYEKLYDNAFHAWYVREVDGALVLDEKAALVDEEIQDFFHRHVDDQTSLGRMLTRNQSTFGLLVEHYWEGSIRWQVHEFDGQRRGKTVSAGAGGGHRTGEPLPVHRRAWAEVKGALSQLTRFPSDRMLALERIVRCPDDASALSRDPSSWRCPQCNREYPTRGLVHLFAPSALE